MIIISGEVVFTIKTAFEIELHTETANSRYLQFLAVNELEKIFRPAVFTNNEAVKLGPHAQVILLPCIVDVEASPDA